MTRERAPVQADAEWYLPRGYGHDPNARGPGTIAWSEHLEAWSAYHRKHPSQSAERIAERGGFSHGELRMFLGHDAETFIPHPERR